MSSEDLESLKRALRERAARILASSQEALDAAKAMPLVRGEVGDVGDDSIFDEAQTTRADLNERDRTTLVLIRDAFARMREGSYGVCVDCGREIELARLRALPWAMRCADDQDRAEKLSGRDPSPTL